MAKIAIVVPRCAPGAIGGIESLALALARDLQADYEVQILTTCAVDYWTWNNDMPAGYDDVEGVRVRRFTVDAPRRLSEFNRLSRTFRYRLSALTVAEQEAWLREQGPYSTALLRCLADERTTFDAIVFMPYLYATTYFGLPLVRDRAILLPAAHDEWPLYFPVWKPFFERVRSFIFLSPEERELLARRLPSAMLFGEEIHPRLIPQTGEVAQASTSSSSRPTLLYLGRMDDAKGVTELADLFEDHKRANPASPWRLLFAGPGGVSTRRADESVTYLGEVDELEKWQLLASCSLFVMPSRHESLSIALLEAWSAGRAALVTGSNPVLLGQVRRANGGLWYFDQRTFDAALAALEPIVRDALGEQGRRYVKEIYGLGDSLPVMARAVARARRE